MAAGIPRRSDGISPLRAAVCDCGFRHAMGERQLRNRRYGDGDVRLYRSVLSSDWNFWWGIKVNKKGRKLKTKTKLLPEILIDPYRQDICRIEISPDTDVWRKVLPCQYVKRVALGRPYERQRTLLVTRIGFQSRIRCSAQSVVVSLANFSKVKSIHQM